MQMSNIEFFLNDYTEKLERNGNFTVHVILFSLSMLFAIASTWKIERSREALWLKRDCRSYIYSHTHKKKKRKEKKRK